MTTPQPVVPPWDWHVPAKYSAGIVLGDLVFVSGQVGIRRDGSVAGPDFQSQVHQAFSNLRDVLTAAGSDLPRVVKVTIYLTDRNDFQHIPALRARYFAEPYPADTTVIVAGLAREGLLVEIDAIAAR